MSSTPETSRSTRKRKTSRSAGGLKKSMELDHVTVQETFQFALANHNNHATTTVDTTTTNTADTKNTQEAAAMIGQGAYVTAIVQSKRYYGTLMDQATLQVAAQQQLQEEQQSLSLNERMKQAVSRRMTTELTTNNNKDYSYDDDDYDDAQPPRPIQKFRYKDGLRYLLATYTNAAALDVSRDEIVEACDKGGGMVGPFYYHYEVSVCVLLVFCCFGCCGMLVVHSFSSAR